MSDPLPFPWQVEEPTNNDVLSRLFQYKQAKHMVWEAKQCGQEMVAKAWQRKQLELGDELVRVFEQAVEEEWNLKNIRW